MIPLEELSKIREFGERSHRMTCSDPDDPARRTTYGDLGKLAAALEAVLSLAEHEPRFTRGFGGGRLPNVVMADSIIEVIKEALG